MAFKEGGSKVAEIAKKLGRSRRVVRNFLKVPDQYVKKKRSGRPPTLTPMMKHRLIREASRGLKSARQLKNELSLNLSIWRVQQILREEPTLVFVKMVIEPPLTPRHMEA